MRILDYVMGGDIIFMRSLRAALTEFPYINFV